MVALQGDLFWVRLPPPRGSEPSGKRPALIIQSNIFNRSNINTVIVAVITSNLKYESLPGNVRLLKGEGGIPKASVINISQLHSIDRSYLEKRIGTLSPTKFELVRKGIRMIFAL